MMISRERNILIQTWGSNLQHFRGKKYTYIYTHKYQNNTLLMLPQKQKSAPQGCILSPRHCITADHKKQVQRHKRINAQIFWEKEENLGNASVVWRSQTTLFASAFHALMPPSAVPMRSFCQNKQETYKNYYLVFDNLCFIRFEISYDIYQTLPVKMI